MIELIDSASGIVTSILIPLAFALCLLYFFWGVVKYIGKGAASEEAAKEGKQVMVWGIIGLFVAFSIWGIIEFIKGELGIPYIKEVMIKGQEVITTEIHYEGEERPEFKREN